MDRVKALKVKGEKMYRGGYTYLKHNNIYCEEVFEAYKENSDLSMSIFADIHSRVVTGELLTMAVDMRITKDFIPTYAKIEKNLGKQTVVEIYDFNSKENQLNYSFITEEETENTSFPVPPKFHITTPATCLSMIFLKSKKENTTGKNHYNLVHSPNLWEYVDKPEVRIICIQREGLSSETINIGGNSLQATQYRVFEETGDPDRPPQVMKSFVSKYMTIPYQLRAEDGTKIQVKYFNNLDKDS